MNKNVKSIFFVSVLLILLVGITAVGAVDTSNDTTTVQDNTETVTDSTSVQADNNIVTTTKNIKKEEQTTDLYVSDTDGSDDNSGTETSPYKTIQKALNNANSQNTFNIHIAEGTYKGLGNTNLTVNGSYLINFIGEGNAIIDGEVNYTEHITQDDDYFWGSSKVWEPYDNGTGNWAMKISKGNGLVTISNLTIQNCWNPGGSSIATYDTSTIDNYANLIIDNVSFIFNHGGVGGAIRNNNGATITINNSLFEKNRKSSTTGNYGAGIYNNGTATIINSTFQNNYARWGTITNDDTLTLINSTLRDNIAYDGGSSYKTGSGITADTSQTDFYNQGTSTKNIMTNIESCIFINNQQADIYGSYIIVNNSIFNQSSGIVAVDYGNITNNIFDSPISTSIYKSLSNTDTPVNPMNLKSNNKIINNTILKNTNINSQTYDLIVTENNIIINNTFDRIIKISGDNNVIKLNNISSTLDTYAINISSTYNNNNITDNYLLSNAFSGDDATYYKRLLNNIIENNTPVMTSITLTEENYDNYIKNNKIISKYDNIDTVKLDSTLTNHNIILDNGNNITITQIGSSNLINITITVKNNTTVNVASLKVNNTNKEPILILETDNNIINKNTFQTNGLYTITSSSINNSFTNNILYSDIYVGDNSIDANFDNIFTSNTPNYTNYLLDDDTYSQYFDNDGLLNTENLPTDIHFMISGTLSNKNIILQNNTINITKRNDESIIYNSTITARDNCNLIIKNITIINTDNKTAMDISIKNPTIQYNYIESNGIGIYLHDINVTSGKLLIQYNNFNIKNNTAVYAQRVYGYSMSSSAMISRLTDNKINVTGDNVTAVEIFNSTFSELYQNTINITANNATGIKITNPNYYPYVLMINGRWYYTTTVYRYNTININANDNAVGMITENLNFNLVKSVININSNNTATGWQITNTTNKTTNIQGTTSSYNNDININSKNTATAIIATGESDVLIPYINITINATNTTGIRLYDTSHEIINGNITLNGKNNIAVDVENGSDISINNLNLKDTSKENDYESLISIKNSNSIELTDNKINGFAEYAIKLENTKNTNIEYNILITNQIGDNSVYNDNPNNLIRNNEPTQNNKTYLLTEDNFYDFFDENGILRNNITEDTEITQIKDISNKNITINKKIIYNQLTSELYNTTITLNSDKIIINNLTIENTDKNPLIVNSDNNQINNIIINLQQSITNTQPIVINGKHNILTINSITLTGLNNNTETTLITINNENNTVTRSNDASTFSTSYEINIQSINNLTIFLFNNTDKNKISSIKSKVNDVVEFTGVLLKNAQSNYVDISSETINTNGISILLINSSFNEICGSYSGNSVNTKNYNLSGAILKENSNDNIFKANFNSKSGHEKEIIINNSHNNIFKSLSTTTHVDQPIIIINSNNNEFIQNIIKSTVEGFLINITEGRNNTIHYNSLKSLNLEGNNTVIQEVYNETTIKNTVNNNYYQNGTGAATKPYNPLKVIINMSTTTIDDEVSININLFARNRSQTSQPTLTVDNGTLTVKVNSQTYTFDVESNELYTVNYTATDSEKIVVEATYLGNASVYEPSTNTTTLTINKLDGILTDENYYDYFTEGTLTADVTSLTLGSNIYNKDLIFGKKITFNNPNKYTIYNSTISTNGTSLTNINLINEDDRKTSIIINGGGITSSNIKTNGNYQKTIIFTGSAGIFSYNNIEINGTNNKIISGTAGTKTIEANNITVQGNNTNILELEGAMTFRDNKIEINSNNTNIIDLNHFTASMGTGMVYSNNLQVNGDNINVIYVNDYVATNFGLNIVNINGTNNTAITYKNTGTSNMGTSTSISNNNITINTTTNNSPIIIKDSWIGLSGNNIITNTNYVDIPIISVDSNEPVNIRNNYIESLDLCGNNAVNGASTISGNTPNNNGEYKINIAVNKDSVVLNHENKVKITVTNMYNESIEGEITVISNNQTLTAENYTITFSPARETYNPPTATFTNNIVNQTITTKTRLTTSTNITNSIINIADTPTPNIANSLATTQNQIYLINNTLLNTPIYNMGTTYIYNSTLNGTLYSYGTLYVDKDTIIGNNFKLYTTTIKIFTNNEKLLEILEQNNIIPQNNPKITITYTDPEGKYETTTINKTFKTINPQLTVDPITATVGQTVNITVRITAENETLTDINKGKVTFKVNGKTLKDTNGKVIYAKVVNGIASIEHYVIPQNWTKEGSTIQAVYSGSSQCAKLTTDKINLNISKALPTLTTESINTTIGSTITLKATVTDNDKVINTGKIVFKINGKTVKDANGKVIYAKVVNNTVTVEYTLPESYKAKDYTITATFISNDYDKISDSKSLTLTN